MKVGDYVRTKYGISKIENISPNEYDKKHDYVELADCVFNGLDVQVFFTTDEIIKSRQNPIDLIEVGDYVNGLKITLINEPSMANCNKRLLYAEDEERYLIKMFDKQDIKSIVTKEQFESMEYKVK